MQGKNADLYQKEGYTAVILKDDAFAYVISGDISQEEAIQTMESITVKK